MHIPSVDLLAFLSGRASQLGPREDWEVHGDRARRFGRAAERSRINVIFLIHCFGSHVAAADFSVPFAGTARATSSCRRLILRKAGFTNHRYSILMQFFIFFTFLRILPN
jgi:hypothetical protein